MQTEKAKSSHFDRTRGGKNKIYPTLDGKPALEKLGLIEERMENLMLLYQACMQDLYTVQQVKMKS